MAESIQRVVLVSLDPWNEVWRRNQHLAARLVRIGLAERVVFVNPPAKLRHVSTFEPEAGITVVTPHLVAPRHRGGLRLVGREMRARYVRSDDVLWINDPMVGRYCLRRGARAVYDVTDDWRTACMADVDRAGLVAAEDHLARSVTTVVCSDVLRERWIERYDVAPSVIHNGVDTNAYAHASPKVFGSTRPSLVYIGTLHEDRIDVDLLLALAATDVGLVHLVGPNRLSSEVQLQLESTCRILLHGQIPHGDVPGWMVAADVLLCPHRITDFTLSLDAIKSFEYLASGRPVVATPTSGFQNMAGHEGVDVVDREVFVDAVARAAREPRDRFVGRGNENDWANRAREFAGQLSQARRVGA